MKWAGNIAETCEGNIIPSSTINNLLSTVNRHQSTSIRQIPRTPDQPDAGKEKDQTENTINQQGTYAVIGYHVTLYEPVSRQDEPCDAQHG